MKVLIDSSVFISYLNRADNSHKKTVPFVKKLSEDKKQELILPTLVILEVAHIMQKQFPNFQETKINKVFRSSTIIEITYLLTQNILSIMKSLNLKTSDAIIASIAKLTNSVLITWDKKLQKEAKKLVETLTPKEFMRKF